MLTIRRSEERGGGDHGWLNTCHTLVSATIGTKSGWGSVPCA